MTDETQGPIMSDEIEIGKTSITIYTTHMGERQMGITCPVGFPLSDAAAVAVAIRKLAGLPDEGEMVDRLAGLVAQACDILGESAEARAALTAARAMRKGKPT